MSEIEDNMAAVTSAPGHSCQNVVTELRIDLVNLEPLLSEECCIYRVPSNLRRVNEAAYTPQFVSVGPLHYGDKNLKKMEKHKLRYLEIFLKRAQERAKSLEDLVRYFKMNEEKIRRCYAETFDHLNSDQFARMILVDASFIIEHILRWFSGRPIKGPQLIFDMPFLTKAILWKDLVLLENQLPFFVLEGLFRMVFEDLPFSVISHQFFTDLNFHGKLTPKDDFKHFTDLVRYYQFPKEEEKEETQTHSSWFSDCSSRLSKVLQRLLQALLRVGLRVLSLPLRQKPTEDDNGSLLLYSTTELHEGKEEEEDEQTQTLTVHTVRKIDERCDSSTPLLHTHNTHSRWFSNCSSRLSKDLQRALQINDKGNVDYLYSATELHEAGVRFQVSQLDIRFADKGVLQIPRFTIKDETEALFRNVMALEQCHYPNERPVCDYIKLLNYLINTEKDVDLLVQNKILVHQLGSNQDIASLVNKLGVEITYDAEKSRHSETIRELNAYYDVPCHKWKATLKHDYFKTPWRGASTIAAITLLLLTVAQTICSFLSL